MVVSIGQSDDGTEDLIKSINSKKIKIFYSQWDLSLRKGGVVLAEETNKALMHVSNDTDWVFYIQGDEVLHEKYYENILTAAKKYFNNPKVLGLLFDFVHFYATYNYVGDSRRWYNKEVRIIRHNKNIQAYKDAQGFRLSNKKIEVKQIDACINHYGWVKSPTQMIAKQKNVSQFWNEDTDEWRNYLEIEDLYNFNDFDSLVKFTGTHPVVMEKRVKAQQWTLDIDISKKKFTLKEKLLYWFEKKTGVRLFDFKNYKKI